MKFLESILQQLVPILVDVLLKIVFAAIVYFIGSKIIKFAIKIS